MMDRRAILGLALLAVGGCGGAGQQSSVVSGNPSLGSSTTSPAAATPVFRPAAGLNSPLGTLQVLSDKNPLAKAAGGKVIADGAAKLARLDKGAFALADTYNYYVADAEAARTAVGEKGLSVPLPKEAKTNPDGSIWVVDGETRHLYTLTGVKREADKPTVVEEAVNDDLVRPSPDGAVPPLGLVARADEAAASKVDHALRIVVKGVGSKDAPAAGTRVRLNGKFSEKAATPLSRSLLRALKKYGAVLVPGDGAPALSALADPRWTKDDRKAIAGLHLSDFEVLATPPKPPVKHEDKDATTTDSETKPTDGSKEPEKDKTTPSAIPSKVSKTSV